MIWNFPYEKPRLLIYSFTFLGLEEPIKVEAHSNKEARIILQQNVQRLPEPYRKSKVIGSSVETPIFGVTEKVSNGQTLIWVGKNYSKSGWLPKNEYQKRLK